MLGTPVENELGDLHAIFAFTNPDVFGSSDRFNQLYVRPIT